ncbi:MAG: DNA cytosine methyltransferase [Leptolyngbya sp. SIOISBB]|nr:DNA cytosine methyltransferase [Leptolyngbya sp. SIOISBB]
MHRKPRLLDLFCCAGGAGMGYSNAGFEVVGVDIRPQPRYPFAFHQSDWQTFLDEHWQELDVLHASPPCQGYSVLKSLSKSNAPLLIPAVRAAFKATGKSYVIENVPGAKRDLVNPLTLRGNQFGLRVIRDRLFEVNPFLLSPPLVPVNGSTKSHRGKNRLHDGAEYITVTGHCFLVEEARRAMGIDWMTQDELAQAIPPAYTQWIGEQLMRVCSGRVEQTLEVL